MALYKVYRHTRMPSDAETGAEGLRVEWTVDRDITRASILWIGITATRI